MIRDGRANSYRVPRCSTATCAMKWWIAGVTLAVSSATAVLAPARLGAQDDDLFKGTPLAGARVEMVGRSLALGLIVGIAATPDGSVLIVDRSTSRVQRITPDGNLATTYGGPGEGPGEFRFPYRVAELSDGSVIVFDLATKRFSEFTHDGKFVRRWATSADIVSLTDIVPLSGRGFAISGIVRDPRAGSRAVHLFDSTFRLIRSFGDLPRARSRSLRETWGAGSLRRTPSGDLLLSRGIPYELNWYSVEGEHQRRVAIAKRTSALADDLYAVTTSGATVTTRNRDDVAYQGPASQLPDGRIISIRIDGKTVYWDVLSASGRLVWSGRKPARVAGYFGTDRTMSLLWFSGETGDGEPVLYRVTLAVK